MLYFLFNFAAVSTIFHPEYHLYFVFSHRRNPSLTGQEAVAPVNGGGALSGDMESLKQEILAEMRREMNKMKTEIIDGE